MANKELVEECQKRMLSSCIPNLGDMRKLHDDVEAYNNMLGRLKGLPDEVDKLQKLSKERVSKIIDTLSEDQKKIIVSMNVYDLVSLQLAIRKGSPQ